MATLHEDQDTFFIISHSNLLKIKNVDIVCRGNQTTHFMFNNYYFFFNCAVYEIMWENTVEWGRLQMAVWCMHIACWIPRFTFRLSNTYCFSIATVRECASMLCYTYISCLVFFKQRSYL
jgi:hypothetical protein